MEASAALFHPDEMMHTYVSRPMTFPDFTKPPVVEVVCGVLFDPPVEFMFPHIGQFSERLGREFPNISEVNSLPPVIETFKDRERVLRPDGNANSERSVGEDALTMAQSATMGLESIFSGGPATDGVETFTLLSSRGQSATVPSNATVNEAVKFDETELPLERGVFLPETLRDALAIPGREAYPEAAAAAAFVLAGLADYLTGPLRVAVTRAGNVALTYRRDRRYANLECDSDGDVVLTLTDRARDDEGEAVVVTGKRPSMLATRIQRFLER